MISAAGLGGAVTVKKGPVCGPPVAVPEGLFLSAQRSQPAEVQIGTVFAVYPIEDEAELETQEARDALGPLVVSRLRYLTANHEHSSEVPEPFRPGFDAYMEYRAGLDDETRHTDNYEGYLVFVPEHLQDFVNPETMRTIATIGSSEEVTAELLKMKEAGVDQVTLQMAGPPESWCRRMSEQVLPHLA